MSTWDKLSPVNGVLDKVNNRLASMSQSRELSEHAQVVFSAKLVLQLPQEAEIKYRQDFHDGLVGNCH